MGIYEAFQKGLDSKREEINNATKEISDKGIYQETERLDVIVYLGNYQIVNVILYSMKDREEVYNPDSEKFSGSINLTGPIFLEGEAIPTKEEENKIKAKILYTLEESLKGLANEIEKPILLTFYKAPESYNIKNKTWGATVQSW